MIDGTLPTNLTDAKGRRLSRRLRGNARLSSYVASLAAPDGLDRVNTEQFIEAVYAKCYGARILSHYPVLIGVRDEKNEVVAAAGMRPALDDKLFLEQYLDRPIEESVISGGGEKLPRGSIVEIGNFAARNAGAAVCLMSAMAASLDECGLTHVAVTATKKLRQTFMRLGLGFSEIAEAKPRALPGNGAEWGSYYMHDPRVVFGPVAPAFSCLTGFLPSHRQPASPQAVCQLMSTGSEVTQ